MNAFWTYKADELMLKLRLKQNFPLQNKQRVFILPFMVISLYNGVRFAYISGQKQFDNTKIACFFCYIDS